MVEWSGGKQEEEGRPGSKVSEREGAGRSGKREKRARKNKKSGSPLREVGSGWP